MANRTKDEILHDHNNDGIDRRGFLKCMAWAGTGAFCVMQGGVLKSYSMSRLSEMNPADMKGELSFVQISDSHMGFQQAGESGCCGKPAGCGRQDQCAVHAAGVYAAHRGYQPPFEAGGIRHRSSRF